MEALLEGARNMGLLSSFDAENIFNRGPGMDFFHEDSVDQRGRDLSQG
jgi:hypothetical protein